VDPETFRRHGHELIDWIAGYLEDPGKYPVLSRINPGDITSALPRHAPEEPEPFEAIMADFERVLVPGLTHWNHPGFLAYFATTASEPGILAEILAAGLNQQVMLWRTSPAATELEEVALRWLASLLGLPSSFEGVIYDTASISTMHAFLAARELAVPDVRMKGLAGRPEISGLAVYCSAEAHSSIDKAAIAIGLGQDAVRRIGVDDRFRLRVDLLEEAIDSDRARGILPIAIVGTVGTTSTTSIDPVPEIAALCVRRGIWLHVDAAYGGAAAIVPSHAGVLAGAAQADSVVVNPHKWLFTPFDLSAFYCRRMDVMRRALSLTPEYLRTSEQASVRNLMDTGVQLGRRFRSLKLWMIMRSLGARGIREALERHMLLAAEFGRWVHEHPDFELLAPIPFSVVCFRWRPAMLAERSMTDEEIDRENEKLLERINGSGEVMLSHTRIGGAFALRLAIGHLRTTHEHVVAAWNLLLKYKPEH